MKKKLMFAIAAVAAMVACNPDDAALKKRNYVVLLH